MGYPRVCPECGADLTRPGAVEQYAAEDGYWTFRIDHAGDLVPLDFTTDETREVYRTAYCKACDADICDTAGRAGE